MPTPAPARPHRAPARRPAAGPRPRVVPRPPTPARAVALAGAAVLAVGLAGCGPDLPEERPGILLASGPIQVFEWIGESGWLGWMEGSVWGTLDIRAEDVETGARVELARMDQPTSWGFAPGDPPSLYWAEHHVVSENEPPEARILRATGAGAAPDTVLTGLPPVWWRLGVSRDGGRVAFMVADTLWVVELETGVPWTHALGSEGDVEFSPGGTRILVRVPWAGSYTVVEPGVGIVAQGTLGSHAAEGVPPLYRWDGESARALDVSGETLREVELETGSMTTLGRLPAPVLPGELGWSEDGTRVAYPTQECVDEEYDLYVFDPHCVRWAMRVRVRELASGGERTAALVLLSLASPDMRPRFAPGGGWIAFMTWSDLEAGVVLRAAPTD